MQHSHSQPKRPRPLSDLLPSERTPLGAVRRFGKRWVAGALLVAACSRSEAPEPMPSRAPAESAAPRPFEPQKVEFSGKAMGTHVTFIAYTRPDLAEPRIRQGIEAAMREIARLEQLMSSWRPDSEVSRVNQNAGQFVEVSPETLEVVEKALWAGQISDGTFDITFQALSGLWRFGDAQHQHPKPPSRAEVERLRPLVDFRKVEVDTAKRRVKLAAKQQMGLGGIAKGYIVDAAARQLTKAGVRDYLVRAGGDLFGAGHKPGGQPWIAGIQDPRGGQDDYFATIALEDHAFSTAGDYARAYVHDGKRYHHIIDPRTGFPATASRSVTVWAGSALLADVIDDAIFILGPKRGLELVESVEGAGAVIVDEHNKVWISQRLQGRVSLLHPPTPGD